MQYRTFEKTGQKISLLGMGAMRLPLKADKTVDEDKSVAMIRRAIDKGVNYVDTAYMYHDGESEKALGKALNGGYREKVLLADKMPVWMAKNEEEMKAIFEEQFARLGTDIIDMYLVHSIEEANWEQVKKFHVIDFLDSEKTKGRIKHMGFSFHGGPDLFKEAIDAYPWDFCQIQLNYMDRDSQAGVAGLKYAGSKGIPVVIMEPLMGGMLTDTLPQPIADLWKEAPIQRSPAAWAFKWVADFPEVLTILSGMSAMEQLEENLEILSDAVPCSLSEEEHAIIDRAAAQYRRLIQYPCTGCKYCMPCTEEIPIPEIIDYYNQWFLYEQNPKLQEDYSTWTPKDHRAANCTACRKCEGKCPQSLPISEIMKKTAKIFGS